MVIKRQCVYTLTYDTEVMFQQQCKLCCLPAGASQNDEEFTITEGERETHYPHIMAYGSMPYVGMAPKKNGGHIKCA